MSLAKQAIYQMKVYIALREMEQSLRKISEAKQEHKKYVSRYLEIIGEGEQNGYSVPVAPEPLNFAV